VVPTKAETVFGLPPLAVYIGLGAFGLLTVAAIARRRS
jgi:hypothetical protein